MISAKKREEQCLSNILQPENQINNSVSDLIQQLLNQQQSLQELFESISKDESESKSDLNFLNDNDSYQQHQQQQQQQLLQSPKGKQYPGISQDDAGFSSSYHKTQEKKQGFRSVKGGQERISLSEKSNFYRESRLLSNSSPLGSSDQTHNSRKSTSLSQHSNQSSTNYNTKQSKNIYSVEDPASNDLFTLKKNLFVNSTLPSSLSKVQQFSQGNQVSPTSKQEKSSRSESTCFFQNSSTPPYFSKNSSNSKDNIILIQKPGTSRIINQKNITTQSQNSPNKELEDQALISQQDYLQNFQSPENSNNEVSQTPNSTYVVWQSENQQLDQIKDSSDKNQSNKYQNLNQDALPYISFIQPELALPGLGASNDSVYMAFTLLLHSQSFASQLQQQNALSSNDSDSSFQLTTSTEQILQELNQLDFQKLTDTVLRTNISSLFNENINNEAKENIQNSQEIITDELSLIIPKIRQNVVENEQQQQQCLQVLNKNYLEQEIIQGYQNQSSKIIEVEQPKQEPLQKIVLESSQKRGFQLSASHLNTKKGFQVMRGSINSNKSVLNSLNSDIKSNCISPPECKFSTTEIVQKQQDQLSPNFQQNEFVKQKIKSIFNQIIVKQQNQQCLQQQEDKSFIYATPDKNQNNQQISLDSSDKIKQKSFVSEVCNFKNISSNSKQMEIIINEWSTLYQKSSALVAKYKLASPNEKNKIEVIDLSAKRKEHEEQKQHVISEIEIQNPKKEKLFNKILIPVQCLRKNNLSKVGIDLAAQNNYKNNDLIQEEKINVIQPSLNLQLNEQNQILSVGEIDNNSYDFFNELEFDDDLQTKLQKPNEICELTNNQKIDEAITLSQIFGFKTQRFNKLINQQSKQQLSASPSMILKFKRMQDACQFFFSDGKDLKLMSPSSIAFNALKTQNINSSNISLIPEKSSYQNSMLSNSFMQMNDDNNMQNESETEEHESSHLQELGDGKEEISEDNYKSNSKVRGKIECEKTYKQETSDKCKQKQYASNIVSIFKENKQEKKDVCGTVATVPHQRMQKEKQKRDEQDNKGRRRKAHIQLTSFEDNDELNEQEEEGEDNLVDKEQLEDNLSNKQINNKIEKNRKKVKKSNKIIYGGPAPSPQYTRLAEIIMPDRYEQYLSQVGGISRSNTVSSQSTQPIFPPTLSKQNSEQSASSSNEQQQQQQQQLQSKAQKKAAQKRKEKQLQHIEQAQQEGDEESGEQQNKIIKKVMKDDEIHEDQMDDESSNSGTQCQNNNKSTDGNPIKNKFDTKNLVKNFLNQFLTFIQSEEEEKQIMQLISITEPQQFTEYKNTLKLFFKNKKFNRALLKEFVFIVDYRKLFLYFLQNRAHDWIMQGRMKDKASHLRALQNFIYICQNFHEIKSWRFRYNFV